MIQKYLSVIVGDLNQFLRNRFNLNENPVTMSNLTGLDGNLSINGENKIVFTVVNIEQETSIPMSKKSMNISSRSSVSAMPPMYFNIYLLVSAYFQDSNYGESLRMLSSSISFFQQKSCFNYQNTPGFPEHNSKMTLEIVNLSINDSNNLWGKLGGKYLPSILYKLRMITFDGDYPVQVIDTISSVENQAGVK